MILPLPPHLVQADCWANVPKAVWRVVRTVPVPWQTGQVSGWVPSFAPLPPQVRQFSIRLMLISFWQPLAAS